MGLNPLNLTFPLVITGLEGFTTVKAKPPVAVYVKNFESFARLALALTDSPPLIWHFKHNRKSCLGIFSVYMSWRGDIPIFAYIGVKGQPEPFLAYKNDADGEECKFVNNMEDTKYFYAPIITLKNPPKIFSDSLYEKHPSFAKPLGIELDSLHSMTRLLYLISSKEFTSFPIWRFKKDREYVLGICVPFEHYYESNALPVFFYVEISHPQFEPFLKYSASGFGGETLEYSKNTSDTKFFYAKIIDVENMPLFPE